MSRVWEEREERVETQVSGRKAWEVHVVHTVRNASMHHRVHKSIPT